MHSVATHFKCVTALPCEVRINVIVSELLLKDELASDARDLTRVRQTDGFH